MIYFSNLHFCNPQSVFLILCDRIRYAINKRCPFPFCPTVCLFIVIMNIIIINVLVVILFFLFYFLKSFIQKVNEGRGKNRATTLAPRCSRPSSSSLVQDLRAWGCRRSYCQLFCSGQGDGSHGKCVEQGCLCKVGAERDPLLIWTPIWPPNGPFGQYFAMGTSKLLYSTL